mgnify:CR=1 FL=1
MRVIDSHTGGQPTRVIVDGGPDLCTGPLAERRELLAREHDDLRQKSILEPKCSEAMVGALFYMALAGASIPTQRAMLMTGVVFLAIILDRSAISLRLVAFAAFIVLLFFSESLLSASFHMSFAAVAGLVAFYDWLRPYWSAWHRRSGWLRRAGLYFLGVSFTTIIATAATAPFALYHFQQLAAYSILGNFIAVPILAFLIMPSILAALFMMPFGLEFIPLYVTDLGVDAVLNIADWVSSLPHSVFRMGAWPQAALVAIVFSGLALILLRGAVRLLCLLPLFIAIIVFSGYSPPDILISDKAKLVSVRDGRGDLYVSNLRSERFARENWMQSYGVDDARVHKWPKEGAEGFVACGEMACRINIQGRLVSYIYHETAAAQECAAADLVVAPFPLYKLCVSETSALRIDRAGTKRKGAHGVWFGDNGGIVIKTSQELRGARPWSSLNESFR